MIIGCILIHMRFCQDAMITNRTLKYLFQKISAKKIGIKIDLFCYPYGRSGTFNQSSRDFLKK